MVRAVVALIWLLAPLVPACTQVPELLSVTPGSGQAGDSIAVTGAGLCDGDCAAAGGQLDVGLDHMTRATITAYADDQLTFVVPDVAPGETSLVLTVDDHTSNALVFDVLASGGAS